MVGVSASRAAQIFVTALMGVFLFSNPSQASLDKARASRAETLITVTFELTPPEHFLQNKSFYLSGNHLNLGAWSPDKIQFELDREHLWSAQVQLPQSYPIELKVTLGDWEHVEVDDNNQMIDNHRFQCANSCRIRLAPENFRLGAFHKRPVSAVGHLEYFHEFLFDDFQNKRTVAVYLPLQYTNSKKFFPVIYASDGQNLFDRATATFGREWQLDENLEEMIAKGKIPPVM